LVDAADSKRFEESQKELDHIINTPGLEKVPIVILGNKIDIKGAVDDESLRQALGLAN
jgi:GTP-binding protein SAR1